MNFRIHIEQDEDAKFVASCPTLPGCWSQGDSRDEAIRSMHDAMTGYIFSHLKFGDSIPAAV